MTERDPDCCSPDRRTQPSRGGDRTATNPGRTVPASADDDRTASMVRLDGGTFTMGTDGDAGFPADGEGPTREVTLDPFYVGTFAVTNAEFLAFVRETAYATDAERFGWSFVFEDFLAEADGTHALRSVDDAPWWLAVEGAAWLRPYGPSSSVLDARELLTHPVTHVSWNDALAYAEWGGEAPADGGRVGVRGPWWTRGQTVPVG